ncbi:hypothetical protein DUI87_35335 [Hirundo rustica rustica]|uniref:Uncharacterized protein n=1 Tax=Hirundo rustica rustica TaxID=333673 RepID=A0A3M0J0Y8_HIRRU|nr:hypothetical protein DUI87_35335 [Hirundo rustica rustica]
MPGSPLLAHGPSPSPELQRAAPAPPPPPQSRLGAFLRSKEPPPVKGLMATQCIPVAKMLQKPSTATPSPTAPTKQVPCAPPPFLAVPEEIPVDKERGTSDPCCRPPSPDNVPLPDELEDDPDDRALLPPAELPAEPTIGLKELTEQTQAVMKRLDERAHAAAELLSTTTDNG